MNVFEAVKNTVTAKQAAEHYGLKVTKNGMACCPFHRDRHPSMKPKQLEALKTLLGKSDTAVISEFADWFDGKKIDEIALCEYLIRKKERKCIHGRFYDLDGEMEDETVRKEIIQ